jgi:hypothetical protein
VSVLVHEAVGQITQFFIEVISSAENERRNMGGETAEAEVREPHGFTGSVVVSNSFRRWRARSRRVLNVPMGSPSW